MKKSFLLISALSIVGASYAQSNHNAARIGIRDMARIDQNQQVAVPNKPVQAPSVKAPSTIDLGTSYNVFTILGDRQNQIAYDGTSDIMTFVHRQNDGQPGGSGIISVDYSTDGGANWTVNPYQTTPVGSGASWNGNRYPNTTVWAPSAVTTDAYIVQVGPALETGANNATNGWAKTFRTSFKLDGSNLDETYDFNSLSTLGDPDEWGAAGLYSNANGVVWYVSTDINNTGNTANDVTDQYSSYFIVRGDFNAGNNNFDWTVVDTINPGWVTSLNGGNPYPVGGLANMAWSPNGQTGYVVIMGAWGTNTMMRPYVMKTTDGGTTWNQYADYDFSNAPCFQTMINPTLQGQETRPFFSSYDVICDGNGDLRIFAEVNSGFSSHPDSLLFSFAFRGFTHLYEAATNSSNGWDVALIDSIYVDDHEWDATNGMSHFARPQASRSSDGSKVFYTWLESDPFLSTSREFPVIHSVGRDVNTGVWTDLKNLSAGTNADFISAYATMSADVYENGADEDYELPIVYGTAVGGGALSDGLTAAQWTYLRGVGHSDADFTNNKADCDLIGAVGVEDVELEVSDLTVFPNPTTGQLQVKVDGVSTFNYTITNMLGAVVSNDLVKNNFATIDISNNAKGVYFLKVDTERGSITRKVMLTK